MPAAGVAAFRALGARVEEASPDMRDVPEIVRLTRGFLMVARHGERVAKHRDALQAGLVENTDVGLGLSSSDVARGELMRTALCHRVRTFMEARDLLITPTAAVPLFPVEDPHPMSWFSVLGLPAIPIPCGFTRAGLPVGLQIVGHRRQEARWLKAAATFEAARPWHDRRPPVVAGA
jgi:amidase